MSDAVKFNAIKVGNIERAMELEEFGIPYASIRYLINICRAQQAALILAKKSLADFSRSSRPGGNDVGGKTLAQMEKICGEINDHVG